MITLNNLLTLAACVSSSVWAEDVTCNPLTQSDCSPDKALGTSFHEDFTKESKSNWFTKEKHQGDVSFDSDNGLGLSLAKQGDNPTFTSNFYIMYGKVSVTMQAAPGTGVVSSFYLQSDALDELDLEWLGGDTTQFQSNYFSQGKTTTYDRGAFHGVNEPTAEFHTYTIDWAMDQTTWSLDGTVVRSLPNTTEQGYPQTPMYIKFGIWAGGDPSNQPGTIEWAGGLTDYTQGPYTMYIKDVIVTDYSSGETYSYEGTSGAWQSIQAKDGAVYDRFEKGKQEFDDLAQGKEISSKTSSTVASSTEVSSTEVSSTKVSSTKVSSTKVSSTEVSSTKASSTEVSSTKASSTEVSSTKVSSTEVSTKASSTEVTSTEASSTKASSTKVKSTKVTSTKASSTEVSAKASSTEVSTKASTKASTTLVPKETPTTKTTSTKTQEDKQVSTSASAASSTHSVKVKSADIAASLPKPILALCLLLGSLLI
ncbi:probable glycosidase Crh1p [Monosporozyma servazzii]